MIFNITKLIVIGYIVSICTISPLQAFDYLPKNIDYDSSIPTPESVLGFAVGEQHLLPEQINHYLALLAQQSPRIDYQVIGRTHQNRKQTLLHVSSADNLKRKDEILKINQGNGPKANKKIVIWLAYSVHGNEASGANAAVLMAYYLAAGQSKTISRLLEDSIIVIEPMLNPDGVGRFAQYVNAFKGKNRVADKYNKEHIEPWPNSRTNHYLFDLNRDWLLLTQPESLNRIDWYHYYQPHVLADFHEMGSNSTYFFQPGVAARKHPLIPKENYAINQLLTQYHARVFDERGVLYYSKETFDDFYFGKGSTYPDINGAIGILFEQASPRGHIKETVNGELTFFDAIKNQLDASIATVLSANYNAARLLDYRQRFFKQALEDANRDKAQRAIVFGDKHDKTRTEMFKNLLKKHRIDVYPLAKKLTLSGRQFTADSAYIIPMQQRQYRLIKAIFEKNTEFKQPIFYDVSAWNIALAYNMPYASLQRGDFSRDLLGSARKQEPKKRSLTASRVGYLLSWSDYSSPQVLAHLLKENVFVKFSRKPLSMSKGKNQQSFPAGSLFVPSRQDRDHKALLAILELSIKDTRSEWFPLSTGLSKNSIDMGSPNLRVVPPPTIALVIGEGVANYDVGAIWHYIDVHLDYPVSLVDKKLLTKVSLAKYSHIITVKGDYRDWSDSFKKQLLSWVKNGGSYIAIGEGAKWLEDFDDTKVKINVLDPIDHDDAITFADKATFDAAKIIGGAIVQGNIDTSHPLAFGLNEQAIYTFRRGTQFLRLPDEPFIGVARYLKKPLVSGYISSANQDQLAETAMLLAVPYGAGHITVFADHPYFRAYWFGSARLLANALFFAGHY